MRFWSKAWDALKRLVGFGNAVPETQSSDHDDCKLQAGSPESELAIAKRELASGNLPHGARHLAELISLDPARRESLELLDQYLRRVNGDEEKLYPIKEQRYFAEEAVRAYAWARKGKYDEAVTLIGQVVQAKPESAYLEAWVPQWLAEAGAFPSLSQQTTEYFLSLALNRFPEARLLKREQRLQLERFVELAAKAPPEKQRSPIFQMTRAGLLRKLGRLDQALELARNATRTMPNWHTCVAEGLILRERGDCEEAARSFQRALSFDREDLSARLEAADGYLTQQEWRKAQAWYGQVLERDAAHPWALPSVLYCEWKASGDASKHARLAELARANPPNKRAIQLLRWQEPYIGFLPEPQDATANVLRKLTTTFRKDPPKEPGGSLKLTVSYLESPSAMLAIEEQLRALGCAMTVMLEVEALQNPDPRLPCRPVQHTLWRYKGTISTQALPSPPPAILRAVAGLALAQYNYEKNWNDAKSLGAQFSGEHVPQFLAAMVNPPPIPEGKDALEWLPRVQLAAAQIIANIGKTWIGSARRDGLYSALFGPRDWTTNAAIIALARLGSDNKEIADDVRAAFRTLESAIADSGYCCFAHALFANWQFLADLPIEEVRRTQQRLTELEKE